MNASEHARPNAVRAFEIVGVLILGFEFAFVSGVSWESAVWIPLMLWLIFSVTRRRSSIARWVLTAFTGLGFAGGAYGVAAGLISPSDVEWTAWILSVADCVELALLWSRGTTEWIATRRFVDARGLAQS